MLLVVCSHEFANGNPHLYSIHERGRFRPLRRMPKEFIEMVLQPLDYVDAFMYDRSRDYIRISLYNLCCFI